jgi:hypothetical protein
MSLIPALLDATEQLAALLERENALFGAQPPRAVARTLARDEAEKRRLAGLYERGLLALRQDPKLKAALQPAERDRLGAAGQRFHAAADEHRRRLGALRNVTERLIKAVADAAEGVQKPVQTYNRHAVVRPAFRPQPAARPLAVNRSV